MKATIWLYCTQCMQPVEQKSNLSIIAPGAFGVEIDPCSCGSKTFFIQLVDDDCNKLSERYEIDNYTE